MTESAPADVPAGVGEPAPAAVASAPRSAGLPGSHEPREPRGPRAALRVHTAPGSPRRVRRTRPADLLGLAPFAAYVAVFLGAPAYAVITAAFQDDSGDTTLSNVTTTLKDPYRHAFVVSSASPP